MEVLERHGVAANFLLRHSPSQKIKRKKEKNLKKKKKKKKKKN